MSRARRPSPAPSSTAVKREGAPEAAPHSPELDAQQGAEGGMRRGAGVEVAALADAAGAGVVAAGGVVEAIAMNWAKVSRPLVSASALMRAASGLFVMARGTGGKLVWRLRRRRNTPVDAARLWAGWMETRYAEFPRAWRARLLWALSRSQPEPGMELRNSAVLPHSLHSPMLVGPLGLAIIQWCWQSDASSTS